ncbi:unnamed protein product [Cuscuta campestris]|uniref:Uncharacterized protein n=1 Tax=Cuscuta campestris TaxID=132261 RepID=A0A484LDR5_9ASTE|nr:unnamed protein product [Cuscuta campestris]
MALSNKIGFFILLLVCGMILEGKNGNAETICTLECNTKAVYIRCLPDKKKTKIGSGGCTNCCVSRKRGCQLYDSNDRRLCAPLIAN